MPKVLQKQFWANEEYVWYCKKEKAGSSFTPPTLTHVDKAFCIKNYYTVLDGGQPSDIVERRFYGALDNYLGNLIPDVTSILTSGQTPVFNETALKSLRSSVHELVKRTPDFIKRSEKRGSSFDDEDIGREIIENAILACGDDKGNKLEKGRYVKDLEDATKLREIGRDIRVRSTVRNSEKVNSILNEFQARIVQAEEGAAFILSSMIAYRIGNGGSNGISNPNMEMWLPISPRYAIVLLRDQESKLPPLVTWPREAIRDINEFAVKQSASFASHSMLLSQSLSGKKARQIEGLKGRCR